MRHDLAQRQLQRQELKRGYTKLLLWNNTIHADDALPTHRRRDTTTENKVAFQESNSQSDNRRTFVMRFYSLPVIAFTSAATYGPQLLCTSIGCATLSF